MISVRRRLWLSRAGFFAAPAAWAVHQQVSYMLVPVSCETRIMLVPVVTLLSVLVAIAGGYLSWMPWHRAEQRKDGGDAIQRFLAQLSAAFAVLFAFAILLQGAATLFLNGCQR
jgi:hypothetical protein